MKTSQEKIYYIITIVSVVLAALSGIYYYNEKPFGDAGYYYNAAKIISSDFMALFTTDRIGAIESLNAIFQGVVMLLPGNDFVPVYAMQIIIYAITALFIFKLAEKFLGRIGALVVLGFYFIQYNHFLHVYNFKPGVWVNFFIIMVIFQAYKIINDPENRKNYIWIGLWSGLLLLTDLRYLPHLLFMFFIFLFTKANLSMKVKQVALGLAVLILTITPWIIRQSLVFEKFIFISDQNTITIHKALNTAKFKSLNDYNFLAELKEEDFNRDFGELKDSLSLTPGELTYAWVNARAKALNSVEIPINEKYADLIKNGIYTEDKIRSIIEKHESKSYAIKLLKRGVYLWQPFSFTYRYDPLTTYKVFIPPASTNNNLNRILTVGILLPFFILGGIILLIKNNLFGILLIGFFLAHTAVHALTFVQWRYLLPILPFVTMVSIYGFKNLPGKK